MMADRENSTFQRSVRLRFVDRRGPRRGSAVLAILLGLFMTANGCMGATCKHQGPCSSDTDWYPLVLAVVVLAVVGVFVIWRFRRRRGVENGDRKDRT